MISVQIRVIREIRGCLFASRGLIDGITFVSHLHRSVSAILNSSWQPTSSLELQDS